MRIILRQIGSGTAEVVYENDFEATTDTLFTGGRVAAKKFIKDLRTNVGWENVPAFCEKKSRGRHPHTYVEIP